MNPRLPASSPARPPHAALSPRSPLTPTEAYVQARALWPEKTVSATEFRNTAGRHCTVGYTAGGTFVAFHGSTFEEALDKAVRGAA